MSQQMKFLVLAGIVIVATGFVAHITYTLTVFGVKKELTQFDQACNKSFGDVQVVYQMRADKLPALVTAYKAQANQDIKVLETLEKAMGNVTSIENDIAKSGPTRAMQDSWVTAQMGLSTALRPILAIPKQTAGEALIRVIDEISGVENRIAQERRKFNGSVEDYNNGLVGSIITS